MKFPFKLLFFSQINDECFGFDSRSGHFRWMHLFDSFTYYSTDKLNTNKTSDLIIPKRTKNRYNDVTQAFPHFLLPVIERLSHLNRTGNYGLHRSFRSKVGPSVTAEQMKM